MNYTEKLAEFATLLEYSNLAEDVLIKSKMCVLDILGTALFGSTRIEGKIVAEFAMNMGTKEESTIIGSGWKTCAPHASLANGTMAHSFELDDTYLPAIHHPGSVVITAALSIGEKEHSSGEEVMAAIVAGYEVMNRIGESLGGDNTMRGFFATGTNGPFGAAVAAGKLLGLNEDQMVSALGIAGSQAAGLLECLSGGGETKRLGAGIASQSGVTSALLAQKGFKGPTAIIEGKYGYCRVYSDKCDLSRLTTNLGSNYSILSTAFKLYPCCKALHAPIDAAMKLANDHNLKPEAIEGIVVGGYGKFVDMHAIYEPPDTLAAQFSLPYTIAVAIFRRRLGHDEFTDTSIRDPKILELAKKIKITVDHELAPLWPKHAPGKVTIRLRDGTEYSETVIDPKGDPKNPISNEEVRKKFRSLALTVLQEDRVLDVMKRIDQLQKETDISELTGVLHPPRGEENLHIK